MAEINNYVAAGGCRSVNALSPHPGPEHCDLAHVERNIPVVADAIWRIRDRLTNVATRLSAFSSDKAPPGWLVARSV